ncbi:MAG: glycine--tRNA ligase subunit beta [Alphaproteobacteria bacterium]
MSEFLLELLSEEIPARMQARAAEDLKRLVTDGLKKARLDFTGTEAFVTPRRLVLVVDGLPDRQPDLTEERKGPRVGAPDKAIEGFLRAAGLESLDQCEKRDMGKGGEVWFAVSERQGTSTVRAILDFLGPVIWSFPWPKSMRWGHSKGRYVRPLHNVLLIFNGEKVDGQIDFEGGVSVPFSDTTRGHRFLAPDSFAVSNFAEYRDRLRDAYVIIDPAERRAVIARDLAAQAAAEGLTVRDDPALLDEVAGLVEWPVALIGDIDAAFMDVPAEALTSSMRTHQKYFSLLNADGSLAPRFGFVANMAAADGGRAIVAGNERVLRARLSDAKFFWDQDRRIPLADRAPALDAIVFHAKLGTVAEKVQRIAALAADLSQSIPGADRDSARGAALLCKADLVTGMVGEFPDLQGVMGRYYALGDGEGAAVADAIAEHYSPLGPNDRCPTAPVSVAVALADKIDTLVGFWLIDEKPTGSKDPFALRRAALGVIRLILENRLRLPLRSVFNASCYLYEERFGKLKAEEETSRTIGLDVGAESIGVAIRDTVNRTTSYRRVPSLSHAAKLDYPESRDLLGFFADRLKVYLREQGVRHDLIAAIFEQGDEDDLVRLMARVDALAALVASNDGENLLIANRRAANIVRIESKKDSADFVPVDYDPSRAEGEEAVLWAALEETRVAVAPLIEREEFAEAMNALARLRAPVDLFFDKVTVNADDAETRRNRLCLLAHLTDVMRGVADFGQIEG